MRFFLENKSIGSRIKLIREHFNVQSQKLFSEILDIPFRTLQSYEQDKVAIPHSFLIKLKNKYSISLDWLLMGYGNMIFDKSDTISIPQHITALVSKSYELNPDGLQNTLVEFIIENSLKQKLRTYDKSISFIRYIFWDRYDTVASYRFMQHLLKKIQKNTDLKHLQVENSKQILQKALEEYSLGIIEFFKNSLQQKDKPITSKLIIETLDDWDAYCILKDIDLAIDAFEDSIKWLSFKLVGQKIKCEE